eukprot:jgi/Tetstr1/420442/TSEL_011555.t1
MTIPLGALCSTGRIVEDVRQTLLVRGHATNSHIRVHLEQPKDEDTFGYALAEILNNCAERKQYDEAGKKNLLEAGFRVSDELHGLVGVLKQQQKRAGGIIKHNTNAAKNLAAK